jgi:hypothetical protein
MYLREKGFMVTQLQIKIRNLTSAFIIIATQVSIIRQGFSQNKIIPNKKFNSFASNTTLLGSNSYVVSVVIYIYILG